MITLYARRDSSNSAKVLWLLDELGQAFDLRLTGGKFGGTDTPQFRKLNPFGKVPALELEDGRGLFESQAILRYLAAEDSPGALWPEEPVARARVDGWMDWLTTALVPPLGRYRKAAPADRAPLLDAVTAAFTALDAQLRAEGFDYIAGNDLTLADLCAAPAVHRWFLITDPRPDLPALAAYHARLRGHDTYLRHIEAVIS